MTVTLGVPVHIAQALGASGDLLRRALEALASDGHGQESLFRSGNSCVAAFVAQI